MTGGISPVTPFLDELRGLRTQLSRVGNNLNQLDRILSRSRKDPYNRTPRRTCDPTATMH